MANKAKDKPDVNPPKGEGDNSDDQDVDLARAGDTHDEKPKGDFEDPPREGEETPRRKNTETTESAPTITAPDAVNPGGYQQSANPDYMHAADLPAIEPEDGKEGNERQSKMVLDKVEASFRHNGQLTIQQFLDIKEGRA